MSLKTSGSQEIGSSQIAPLSEKEFKNNELKLEHSPSDHSKTYIP